MLYLKTQNISYSYPGADPLFEEIGVSIDNNTRCGLIGHNGSGKSTFFNLLLGKLNPTSGSIIKPENLNIGYLPQEHFFEAGFSVEEQLWSSRPKLVKIRQTLDDPDSDTKAILAACTSYEHLGGYKFETEIEQVLKEFNLSELRSQSASYISGGEKTRLSLASIIVRRPDMLLLDEPTNHLDLHTLKWLENYLNNCKIPYVVISHDRVFIDQCVNRIWEIDENILRVYSGNYSFYFEEKKMEYNRQKLAYEMQQKKIRQLKKAARNRKQWAFTHQAQTRPEGFAPVYESLGNSAESAMKRAKNLEKRLEMMIEKEEAKMPKLKKKHRVMFESDVSRRGRYALRLESLSKGFSHNLFEGLNLALNRGERLAITGVNGSGKTTLLRLIAGLDKPDKGKVSLPESTSVAYFAQEYENLDLNNTILEEILDGQYKEQATARTLLGCLGIRREMVFREIKSLSLGERSKVSLAKTMLSKANLLLLDEPTNHLEILSREVIEEALLEYDGTIIFVSHDRMFSEKLATLTWSL